MESPGAGCPNCGFPLKQCLCLTSAKWYAIHAKDLRDVTAERDALQNRIDYLDAQLTLAREEVARLKAERSELFDKLGERSEDARQIRVALRYAHPYVKFKDVGGLREGNGAELSRHISAVLDAALKRQETQ